MVLFQGLDSRPVQSCLGTPPVQATYTSARVWVKPPMIGITGLNRALGEGVIGVVDGVGATAEADAAVGVVDEVGATAEADAVVGVVDAVGTPVGAGLGLEVSVEPPMVVPAELGSSCGGSPSMRRDII